MKEAANKRWSDPDWVRAYYREKYRLNKTKIHGVRMNARLKREYGISLEVYTRMFQAQGGLCAICEKPATSGNGKCLQVDHSHSTGEVRALLCAHCNRALGAFGDDAQRLNRAAQYLDNYNRA